MCPLYGGRLWFKCSCGTWKKCPLYGVSAFECPLWRGFVITDSLGIRPGQNFLERCPFQGVSTVLMNKPAYLGLSILEIKKKVIYGFLHDCVKRKYEENATIQIAL